jgi:hypothetical protein
LQVAGLDPVARPGSCPADEVEQPCVEDAPFRRPGRRSAPEESVDGGRERAQLVRRGCAGPIELRGNETLLPVFHDLAGEIEIRDDAVEEEH